MTFFKLLCKDVVICLAYYIKHNIFCIPHIIGDNRFFFRGWITLLHGHIHTHVVFLIFRTENNAIIGAQISLPRTDFNFCVHVLISGITSST